MSLYRSALPQLGSRIFLTDVGLETMLLFHDGMELPAFASYPLLDSPEGIERLRRYYRHCLAHAASLGYGFVLETPTWRASRDWGCQFGHDPVLLEEYNRRAVALMEELRSEFAPAGIPIVVSGNIGPRADAYSRGAPDAADAYQHYHREQIQVFARSGADMVSAFTISNVPEAVGITRAAAGCGMPLALSFTVETDGRLPAGQTLREAIEAVDAATGGGPAYYMLNCAHPTHFEQVLEPGAWSSRIRGLRANASRRSHAELDESTTLDDGDPVEFGAAYAALRRRLPQLVVLGGCCGTDHRHVEAVAVACSAVEGDADGRGALAAVAATTLALYGFLSVTLGQALLYPTVV